MAGLNQGMNHVVNSESIASQLPSTDNPILDELLQIMVRRFEVLVDRGFLAPHFLSKMVSSPNEVIKFIRQNRSVVSDTLNKRLNKKQRPTRQQLEQQGIVPRGYFNYGHDMAMKTKHRRKSSAQQDLEMMLKLRPQKEEIIKQGIVGVDEMKHGDYYQFDAEELDGFGLNEENEYFDDNDDDEQNVPWEISLLSSLLFKTISEALKKSCLDTQQQEAIVLQEMIEMNNEMKSLRDVLDKYFLNDNLHETMIHEHDENLVREKFHSIQEKLLHISQRQNRIHEKLRILNSVERSMVQLQNNYQIRLSALKKTEEQILSDLQEQKQRRDRAIKIMHAEKSHKSWAMTKLDYTINIAKDYNKSRDGKSNNTNDDLKEDIEFVNELEKFLTSLRNISEHQKQIVRDFDGNIEDLEQHLISIRYDMAKVRTMTFKKIYDLHKQVQIAESLELGYRRLSVASATEIERERRHHNIKIMRQLHTLNSQIKEFEYEKYEKNLMEIIDIEIVMSSNKLKSFFSVYVQIMAQTIIDIELTYNNLNSELPPIDGMGTTNSICNHLYGINNIIDTLHSQHHHHPQSLNDKLSKCAKFLKKIKKAIKIEQELIDKENNKDNNNKHNEDEKEEKKDDSDDDRLPPKRKNGFYHNDDEDDNDEQKTYDNDKKKKKAKKVKTFKVNDVMVIVARKLCVHCRDDIDTKLISEVPKFAESKTKDIFQALINGNKIFKTNPKSKMDAAKQILLEVYNVKVTELNI